MHSASFNLDFASVTCASASSRILFFNAIASDNWLLNSVIVLSCPATTALICFTKVTRVWSTAVRTGSNSGCVPRVFSALAMSKILISASSLCSFLGSVSFIYDTIVSSRYVSVVSLILILFGFFSSFTSSVTFRLIAFILSNYYVNVYAYTFTKLSNYTVTVCFCHHSYFYHKLRI